MFSEYLGVDYEARVFITRGLSYGGDVGRAFGRQTFQFLKAARNNYVKRNPMSMEEIDQEIEDYRREKRG